MSSVKSVSSVREKTSTKYASNPIGVTSHITPLPAGEGLGEGPLSYGFETVRKKFLLDLCVLWEKKLCSVREKKLYEVCKRPNRGNLTYYAPRHSERGWG